MLLVFRGLWNVGTSVSMYMEIMLRNKSLFQISTLICLSSISICNLLIHLPTYIYNTLSRTVSQNEQIWSQLREVRRFCTVKYPKIFPIPVICVKDLVKTRGIRGTWQFGRRENARIITSTWPIYGSSVFVCGMIIWAYWLFLIVKFHKSSY
jgi:hypothetical protein